MQTSFLDVADKPIGPLPSSFFLGDNAALMASIAPLYLSGSVLDVTYGRGMWWKRFQPEPFLGSDLVDGVDFRSLPHEDGSWDTVCFDPPYIPTRAAATASPALEGRFRSSYGLGQTRNKAELDALVADGLAECARVAQRWVLAKCCDYAENAGTFVLGHVSAILAGERAGLRVHDLIVHAGGGGPGRSRIRRVVRSSRAHSYLIVFRVRRRRAENGHPGERVIGRVYMLRGEPVIVLIRWKHVSPGECWRPDGNGGFKWGRGRHAPRNVLIERMDGSLIVRPFRGLRRLRLGGARG